MSSSRDSSQLPKPIGFSQHRRSNSTSSSSSLALQNQQMNGAAEEFHPHIPESLRLGNGLLPPIIEGDEPNSSTSSNYENLPNTVFIGPVTPNPDSHATTPVLNQLAQFSETKDSFTRHDTEEFKEMLNTKRFETENNTSPTDNRAHRMRNGTRYPSYPGAVIERAPVRYAVATGVVPNSNNPAGGMEREIQNRTKLMTSMAGNVSSSADLNRHSFHGNGNLMPSLAGPMNAVALGPHGRRTPTNGISEVLPAVRDQGRGLFNASPYKRLKSAEMVDKDPNYIPLGARANYNANQYGGWTAEGPVKGGNRVVRDAKTGDRAAIDGKDANTIPLGTQANHNRKILSLWSEEYTGARAVPRNMYSNTIPPDTQAKHDSKVQSLWFEEASTSALAAYRNMYSDTTPLGTQSNHDMKIYSLWSEEMNTGARTAHHNMYPKPMSHDAQANDDLGKHSVWDGQWPAGNAGRVLTEEAANEHVRPASLVDNMQHAQLGSASSTESSGDGNNLTNSSPRGRSQSTIDTASSSAHNDQQLVTASKLAKELADIIRNGGVPPNDHRDTFRQGQAVPQPSPSIRNPTSRVMLPDPIIQQFRASLPTEKQLIDNEPFINMLRQKMHFHYGVLKLTRIPWDVTTEDVLRMMGHAAKQKMLSMPVGSANYAVHIMMDRLSSKTEDCFIEFFDESSALEVLEDFKRKRPEERIIKNKHIGIEESTQTALMSAMFPKATHIKFTGLWPDETTHLGERKGFVLGEELHGMNKALSRTHHFGKAPMRPFEAMISLLSKYPWTFAGLYTIKERDLLAHTCYKQICDLRQYLQQPISWPQLSSALLDKLMDACLKCIGFSESQRMSFVDAAGGLAKLTVALTPTPKHWPFHVLRCKTGSSEDKIMFYGAICGKTATNYFDMDNDAKVQKWRELPFGCRKFLDPETVASYSVAEACSAEGKIVKQAYRDFLDMRQKDTHAGAGLP